MNDRLMSNTASKLASGEVEEQDLNKIMVLALVETMADAIVVVNSHGKIALVNGQTESLFGYKRGELIGRELEMLIPARYRDRHLGYRTGFVSNPHPRPMGAWAELFALRKDGSEIPVEIGLGPFTASDRTYVSAVIRDVTDRKRLEAESESNRMKMVASARLSALGTMAGGIAHEINNPLAVIHALASDLVELEEDDVIKKDVAQRAGRIQEYAERIAKIVRSLRHLAREGDHDALLQASVAEIVERVLDLCRERFRRHSIDLQTNTFDPDLRIACREVQISQILVNLLQNAYDAMDEQPKEKWVRMEVAVDHDTVVLSVIDSGNGVPPELKARIMEPFFTTKPVGKGTGLGLSLSKQIAEQHGGTLELGERDGHTCFSLRLSLDQRGSPRCV